MFGKISSNYTMTSLFSKQFFYSKTYFSQISHGAAMDDLIYIQWVNGHMGPVSCLGLLRVSPKTLQCTNNFPVMVAMALQHQLVQNSKLLFHVDNNAVVQVLNSLPSESDRVIRIVRKLVFLLLQNIFRLKLNAYTLKQIALQNHYHVRSEPDFDDLHRNIGPHHYYATFGTLTTGNTKTLAQIIRPQ